MYGLSNQFCNDETIYNGNNRFWSLLSFTARNFSIKNIILYNNACKKSVIIIINKYTQALRAEIFSFGHFIQHQCFLRSVVCKYNLTLHSSSGLPSLTKL